MYKDKYKYKHCWVGSSFLSFTHCVVGGMWEKVSPGTVNGRLQGNGRRLKIGGKCELWVKLAHLLCNALLARNDVSDSIYSAKLWNIFHLLPLIEILSWVLKIGMNLNAPRKLRWKMFASSSSIFCFLNIFRIISWVLLSTVGTRCWMQNSSMLSRNPNVRTRRNAPMERRRRSLFSRRKATRSPRGQQQRQW